MVRRRWYLVKNNGNCDIFGGEALQVVYVVDDFELFSRCKIVTQDTKGERRGSINYKAVTEHKRAYIECVAN